MHAAAAGLDRQEGRSLQPLHVVARKIERPHVIEDFTAQLYMTSNCIAL